MKKIMLYVCLFAGVCMTGCSSAASQILLSTQKEKVVLNTLPEVVDYLNDQMMSSESEIHFNTVDLEMEDLSGINQYLDGFYKVVESCEFKKNSFSKEKKVTMYCDNQDNYYVEQYLINGIEIPENEKKARRLAKKCKKILKKIEKGNPTDYRKEKRIHDYLVDHIAYGYPNDDKSMNSDAFNTYGALVLKEAVCNGYAHAMKLLCDLAEVPCEIIRGTSDGEDHAWNLVQLDEEWYHVDATWDDPVPDNKNRILYSYFNEDDQSMRLTHQWKKEDYPEAKGQEYNYFQLNDLYCKDRQAFKEKCKELLKDDTVDSLQLMVGDYSKKKYEDFNFLFEICGAKKVKYQIIGKNPYTTIYINLIR